MCHALGGHKGRPYIDRRDNAVHVIRHHDERIRLNTWKSFGQRTPLCGDHPSDIVQLHLSVYNFAEQAGPVVDADSHEIRAFPTVIKPGQAKRTTPVRIPLSHSDPKAL